jgi:hypothetical protein
MTLYFNPITGNFENSACCDNQDAPRGLVVDQASSTVIYLGEGLFGALTSEAKWRISKIDLSTGVRIKLASEDFDQIWDNRTTLTYV